jgi:hypothetical protein
MAGHVDAPQRSASADRPAPGTVAPSRWWAPDAALAAAVAAVGGLLAAGFWAGRSLWFFADEWNVYGDYPLGDLLKPFNGHLSLVPIGIYQVLYRTVGVGDGAYVWFRLAGLAALGVLGSVVLRYGRTRVGPWAGALAAVAVLWNSAGSSDVLFPFLLNFTVPIAALFAIWWHLDRRTAGHDAAAAAWLAVALATSALGLMALAAVVVELAWSRAPLRRWLVLSPGVVLWSLWYLTNRESTPLATDPVEIVEYAARMYLGATTSLAAGWTPGGVLLAVALVVLVGVAALRWRSLDARTLGALAAPAAFIVVTTLTRIPIRPYIPPDELRYRWAVAAYLVGAVLSMWRPRRDAPADTGAPEQLLQGRRAAVAGAVAALVLAVGGVGLWRGMGDWSDMVEGATPGVRANLAAAEAIGAGRIDPDVVLPLSYVPVTAGEYLRGVEEVGSTLDGLDPQTFGGRRDHRRSADRLLVEQLGVAARPTTAAPAPGGGACEPSAGPVRVEPGGTALVRSGAGGTVRVGRFAELAEDAPEVAVPAGDSALRLPRDAAGAPDGLPAYRVWAGPSATVCPLPPG